MTIIRQFRYYLLEDAPEAATRFLEAAEESVEAFCQMPHMGAPKHLKNPLLSELRAWPVKASRKS